MCSDLKEIHKAFISFSRRAERNSNEILYNTFVDSEPLFNILSADNNQVIFGRRGTGKTHALMYLAHHLKNNDSIPIYIDLRSIGSGGAIYGDGFEPPFESGVRLGRKLINGLSLSSIM